MCTQVRVCRVSFGGRQEGAFAPPLDPKCTPLRFEKKGSEHTRMHLR